MFDNELFNIDTAKIGAKRSVCNAECIVGKMWCISGKKKV